MADEPISRRPVRRRGRACPVALIALVGLLGGCGEEPEPQAAAGPVQIAHFPIGAGSVPPGAAATFDPDVSQDEGGSLRVEVSERGRLRLYEVADVGPIQGRILLTGFLRSRDLDGVGLLELRCRPAEGEEAFVRGVRRPVSGTTDWTPQEIGFSNPDLCENPETVMINLLLEGAGTVWVDDLRLWSVPEN